MKNRSRNITKPSNKQQIHIREVYTDNESELQPVIDWFDKTTIKAPDKYFCRYVSDKKSFLRIGFLNPPKGFMEKFDKQCSKNPLILYTKSWLEHPKTKEWDMEMMKFLAHKTYILIKNHFSEFETYYKNSDMRKRDFWQRPLPEDKRAKMSTHDWMHFIHHVFNMMNYSYDWETYLYNMMESGIHYNAHTSKLRS